MVVKLVLNIFSSCGMITMFWGAETNFALKSYEVLQLKLEA